MILGFDTSGSHCATALFDGTAIRAERFVPMPKGQAEHLLPLIEATLADAQVTPRDLTAIGTGTGPGNFTGIRIAVSAARGLALALDIPAIGVTTFEALIGHGTETAPIQPALVTIPGPRGSLYVQAFGTDDTAPRLIGPGDPLPHLPARPEPLHIAVPDAALPDRDWHPLTTLIPGQPLAPAIARIAATRLASGQSWPRPKPLYLKAADAAPSRQTGPVIV